MSTALELHTAPTAVEIVQASPVLITEARGWLVDAYCLDPDEFTASDSRVVQLVAMTYDGGLAEFIRNSSPLLTPSR